MSTDIEEAEIWQPEDDAPDTVEKFDDVKKDIEIIQRDNKRTNRKMSILQQKEETKQMDMNI